MLSVFFSYSHKDEALRDELEKHLTILKRQKVISTWYDHRILAGGNIDKEINTNLENAAIVLALVSSDFLASEYCYATEMQRALELHHAGILTFIPVILRPCDWQNAPFSTLKAIPKDGKPVVKWASLDEAFLDITNSIRAVASQKAGPTCNNQTATENVTASPHIVAAPPRSSNLAIKKDFSEQERDQFLHNTFTYISTYFENSLKELQARNPIIQGQVRLIDANRFTATAYKNGNKASQCTIFIGGYGQKNIAFNTSDQGDTSSYNESLSVESDNHNLFLKPGFMFGAVDGSTKLSEQGAAEHLWSKFIGHLQS